MVIRTKATSLQREVSNYRLAPIYKSKAIGPSNLRRSILKAKRHCDVCLKYWVVVKRYARIE